MAPKKSKRLQSTIKTETQKIFESVNDVIIDDGKVIDVSELFEVSDSRGEIAGVPNKLFEDSSIALPLSSQMVPDGYLAAIKAVPAHKKILQKSSWQNREVADFRPRIDEEEVVSDDFLASVRSNLKNNDNAFIMTNIRSRPNMTVNALHMVLSPMLKAKLANMLDYDKIDDYIQVAFLRLIGTINQPNGWHALGSIEGWLLRVARNAYIESVRKVDIPFTDCNCNRDQDGDRNEDFEETISSETNVVIGGGKNSYDHVSMDDKIDISSALQQVFLKLTDEQRRILTLFMDGYSPEEIAKIIKKPKPKINCLLTESLNLIKGFLEEQVPSPL